MISHCKRRCTADLEGSTSRRAKVGRERSPDAVIVNVKVSEEATDVSAGDGAPQPGQAHHVAALAVLAGARQLARGCALALQPSVMLLPLQALLLPLLAQ